MERRTVRGLKTDVVLVRGTEDRAGTIERESRQIRTGQPVAVVAACR
jgi:hypothetical protein